MRWLISLGAAAVVVAAATPVQALVGPYYGYASAYAVAGHADSTLPYGSNTTSYGKTDEGITPLGVAAGNPWWCDAGDPGCSVSNPPGSDASGWAEVAVDPAAANLGGFARAFHDEGPVGQHCVPNPFGGGGQICQDPSFWGYGEAWGYAGQLYEVASNGSLAPGDPVTVSGEITVNGEWAGNPEITGNRMEAMAILHRVDPANPSPFFEGSGAITSLSSYQDLVSMFEWGDGLLAEVGTLAPVPIPASVAGVSFFPDHLTVSERYPFTAEVQVGDTLFLQSFLDVVVSFDNDQLYHDVKGDFLHTAGTSLAATTAGAVLRPATAGVPEPLSLLLVATGLGAAVVSRRRFA